MNFKSVLAKKRFELGEGPFYDAAARALYWVDIIAGEAWSLSLASGSTRTWSFDQPVSAVVPRQNDGLLVALADGLAFLDPETGGHTAFVAPEGKGSGNRSNEARVDPQGRFWLGTMQNNIGPAGEDLPITHSQGALYRVTPDGAVTRMEKNIGISNTLCWDEARGRLYFADTRAGVIYVYDWNGATGEIANRRVFASPHERGFPDGSALDVEGCLWNARWGGSCIIRYAPDGRIDRIIDVPVQQPTSCVFAGDDLKTLYVTSARAGLGEAANDFDGALLRASVDVAGQACTAFAG
ncbi:SMP-30/gluconolactonase/LRE family protein [Aestuariivirga sp. YIM B02566]|uniref:SMP-30/gluconolactonase/LRE family protein n=1 Tax=Taklimakanibacter albus TaxID=2800327 RepID=A0ACC5REV0_9HYPH|nr:SMP-30/gluconolactonase/LRE family protein [Aestuariivirga sp. YIM B02566]MBK1871216.1 SMP-30/gluconolactonase/LRE family protein [Aestuariivirga sp. YIM B02566]